jgi:hypothetical protein
MKPFYSSRCFSRKIEKFLDTKSEKKEDQSRKQLADGSLFSGSLKNGKPYGKGKLRKPDGTYLEGYFKDGELDDGKGKIIDIDGFVYKGMIKNGLKHGWGTLTSEEEGFRMEGQF